MPPDEDGKRFGGRSVWQAEVEEDGDFSFGKFECEGAHRDDISGVVVRDSCGGGGGNQASKL